MFTGTVDWDEFCTYMLLEYKERQDMNYVNETPFPNPFRFISNPHRDTIVGKFSSTSDVMKVKNLFTL